MGFELRGTLGKPADNLDVVGRDEGGTAGVPDKPAHARGTQYVDSALQIGLDKDVIGEKRWENYLLAVRPAVF